MVGFFEEHPEHAQRPPRTKRAKPAGPIVTALRAREPMTGPACPCGNPSDMFRFCLSCDIADGYA